MRERSEERRGRRLVEGNPRNSPGASYTFSGSGHNEIEGLFPLFCVDSPLSKSSQEADVLEEFLDPRIAN